MLHGVCRGYQYKAGFLDGIKREVITIYEILRDSANNLMWAVPDYQFTCDLLPSSRHCSPPLVPRLALPFGVSAGAGSLSDGVCQSAHLCCLPFARCSRCRRASCMPFCSFLLAPSMRPCANPLTLWAVPDCQSTCASSCLPPSIALAKAPICSVCRLDTLDSALAEKHHLCRLAPAGCSSIDVQGMPACFPSCSILWERLSSVLQNVWACCWHA